MRSESLAAIPLFRMLATEEVQDLDRQCLWRRVAAKEWVIGYQDRDTDVFFVVRGVLRVVIHSASGQEVLLREIRDGEFFGELAAIDGQPRSANIVCVTDATVARMPAPVFRAAVHRYPSVCDQILAGLAGRIRALAHRVNEFSTLGVRHRIYAEILRLSRADPGVPDRAIISPPPTHADIASRVSTRREAVSRELKALERAGLVERRRGALVITNTRLLARWIDQAAEVPGVDRTSSRTGQP